MNLEVIGAGWGRTGTLSTKVALEHLGFGPCYHMIEIFRTHPEHRALWRRAAAGEHIDWSEIFDDYRVAVDWPTCAFWRELAEAYPQANVVLTHRPAADWYESFDATISNGIPRQHPGDTDETGAMMNEVVVQRSFLDRAGSRGELIGRYEEHVAEVRAEVPAERLLVWSPKDGWERLCDFLDVPVPRVDLEIASGGCRSDVALESAGQRPSGGPPAQPSRTPEHVRDPFDVCGLEAHGLPEGRSGIRSGSVASEKGGMSEPRLDQFAGKRTCHPVATPPGADVEASHP